MNLGKKRLRVIAGPNGSGKTTLTDKHNFYGCI
jgi:predicted ABC-type ATPase